MATMTVVTIGQLPNGRFILVQHSDGEWVWCGRTHGWQPNGPVAAVIHRSYATLEKAQRACRRAATVPLPSAEPPGQN